MNHNSSNNLLYVSGFNPSNLIKNYKEGLNLVSNSTKLLEATIPYSNIVVGSCSMENISLTNGKVTTHYANDVFEKYFLPTTSYCEQMKRSTGRNSGFVTFEYWDDANKSMRIADSKGYIFHDKNEIIKNYEERPLNKIPLGLETVIEAEELEANISFSNGGAIYELGERVIHQPESMQVRLKNPLIILPGINPNPHEKKDRYEFSKQSPHYDKNSKGCLFVTASYILAYPLTLFLLNGPDFPPTGINLILTAIPAIIPNLVINGIFNGLNNYFDFFGRTDNKKRKIANDPIVIGELL